MGRPSSTLAELTAAALARQVSPTDVRLRELDASDARLQYIAFVRAAPSTSDDEKRGESACRVSNALRARSLVADHLVALALEYDLAVPSLLLDYIRASVTSRLFTGDAFVREISNRLDTASPALLALCSLVRELALLVQGGALLDRLLERVGEGGEIPPMVCSCTLNLLEGAGMDAERRGRLERALAALRASGLTEAPHRRLVLALVQLLPAEQHINAPLVVAPAASTKQSWRGFPDRAASPPAPDAALLVQSLVCRQQRTS